MGLQFYETGMGKTFYQGTIPNLVKKIDEMNGLLKEIAENRSVKREQKDIPLSQLSEYLDHGWLFIAELSDGRVVIERSL